MFPQGDLRTLAFRKARLQRIAARQRTCCVEAAVEATRPLAWLDHLRERWRRVAPVLKLSALIVGLLAKRSILRRSRRPGRWLRWALSAFTLLRGLNAIRR